MKHGTRVTGALFVFATCLLVSACGSPGKDSVPERQIDEAQASTSPPRRVVTVSD